MSDDFYRKQLESFGIEQTRIVQGDLDEKRRKEREAVSLSVIKALMEQMSGRQWLYSLLDMCMTNGSVFVPNKPDMTTFFLGAQYIGKSVMDQIMQAAPEQYYIMIMEEAARKQAVMNQEG